MYVAHVCACVSVCVQFRVGVYLRRYVKMAGVDVENA